MKCEYCGAPTHALDSAGFPTCQECDHLADSYALDLRIDPFDAVDSLDASDDVYGLDDELV